MKDYSKLTNEELFNELDMLEMSLAQDDAMDGSGELGGIIYEGYEPFFDAVSAEMNKRGLSSDSLIGRTATVETGFYEYATGVVTHVREAETEIDLGNGISGTESYPVVTIVDKDGKEHIGQQKIWTD